MEYSIKYRKHGNVSMAVDMAFPSCPIDVVNSPIYPPTAKLGYLLALGIISAITDDTSKIDKLILARTLLSEKNKISKN